MHEKGRGERRLDVLVPMDTIAKERTLQNAARWHARMHADECTDTDRTAFEQWRRSDVAHAQAYALAERTSMKLDRLSEDPRLRALAQLAAPPSIVDTKSIAPRQTLRWIIPAALAASVALSALVLGFVPEAWNRDTSGVAYESPVDSTRVVTLDDGSTVQLDVGTRMLVSLSPDSRRIKLLSGRAVFNVAHDRSRPFSVMAAYSRTTALGTRFQVQLGSEQVVVTLEQGSVAIDNEASVPGWHEQLIPGEQLNVDLKTAMRNKAIVDPGVATSWTRGRHLFRGTPLHEAIDEVNRYAKRKVRIGDPSLAELPVAGNFIVGDSDMIIAAFAAVLPLRAGDAEDGSIILFRR